MIFTGRADRPTLLHLTPGPGDPAAPLLQLSRCNRPGGADGQRQGSGAPPPLPRCPLRGHRPGRGELRSGPLCVDSPLDRQPAEVRRPQGPVLWPGRLRRSNGIEEPPGDRRRRSESGELESRPERNQPRNQPGRRQQGLPRGGNVANGRNAASGGRAPGVQLRPARNQRRSYPHPDQRGGRPLRDQGRGLLPVRHQVPQERLRRRWRRSRRIPRQGRLRTARLALLQPGHLRPRPGADLDRPGRRAGDGLDLARGDARLRDGVEPRHPESRMAEGSATGTLPPRKLPSRPSAPAALPNWAGG